MPEITNEQYEHVINTLLNDGYCDLAYSLQSRLEQETSLYNDHELDVMSEIYILSSSWLYSSYTLCQLVINHYDTELTKNVLEMLDHKITKMMTFRFNFDCLPVDVIEIENWRYGKNV